ncbi:PREDICTED: small RNA 2'-O-methyltransferase-like isoform X2 [Camelina sativa]|uniref:Small RNA 2'-O-methyltransferase n=1 Tax=Camelina sativa TaxID=90675 RepID=A0ABM0V0V3_CAMSA|nr:PREDICTED: small RNA 2'-O-methyltransferase-like isoform X2 [Camelina sativa]
MAGEEKQTLNPKEIIHDKFGVKASYRIEEVHASSNGCLYRCHLQLPDFTVVSNVFKKEMDSEQSAAELALEKLGIHPLDYNDDDITVEEAWDDIVERIKYIFSDEFLSADHPLGGHIRAALQRDGELCGSVPVSVIATFDTKINSRCKVINPSVDSDPSLLMSYVMKAAAKLPDYVVVSPHEDSLRRKKPYPSAIIKTLATQVESIKFEAVHLQCSVDGEEAVKPVTLDISSGRYYLDIIAEKLGLKDGSQVMISKRTIGKTDSGLECRVYAAITKLNHSWKSREKRPINESSHLEKSRNAKASFVSGLDIHGDAIVASVGYPWRSHDLEHDDVTLKSFYRICCGMSPNGIYKFSRQALIAAQLPFSYTSKSNWRGPFPREILCMFCHQQQLAEPIFTVTISPVKPLSGILRSYQKLKDSECDDSDNQYMRREEDEIPGSGTGYRCEVKILSKSQDLVLDCSPGNFYEKENHAIQNAALKALSWFNGLFDDLDADPDQPCYSKLHLDMLFQRSVMIKGAFPSSRKYEQPRSKSRNTGMPRERKRVQSITDGSLVSICYSVSVEVDADFWRNSECLKELIESNEEIEFEVGANCEPLIELIESNEEIEFEVGTGSMNPHIESAVTQMTVGEYASFSTTLSDAPEALILAASADTVTVRSLLSEHPTLNYSILLLGVKGPSEERMEAAFFKPPLSKQRVEYALKHIRESSASTLVDFGCGSGSLLDSLLDYPTSLQTIIGVDISPKGLARAAKMLHIKLNKEDCNVKSATLYDGSILEFDSRLYDVDIGTCLEVIEHMEEDQACQFGEIVLSLFRPKLLIVSTPNFEFNTILQRSTPETQEEDKTESQLPKFRNHDHKFEWTREQFNNWASKLAKVHNYSVEFSGVGGSGEVEPGFASQIAVFRREASSVENVAEGSMQPYKVIWEWKKEDGDKKD